MSGQTSVSSTTTTATIDLANGSYAYTVASANKNYATSAASGSFAVSGAAVSKSVSFIPYTYAVTFTEGGLPTGTTWYLNVTGQASVSSTATMASIPLANGTYAYVLASASQLYATSPAAGSFAVHGAPVAVTVTFSLVTYAVTFTETGLPTGTNWPVTLSSTARSSSTTTITFSEANGTYAYAVGSVGGVHGL
ncbi:thermopsin precursor, partial [mine drainage metagenome]